MESRFYEECIKGLKSEPKRLNSKYFYDSAGDRLFQEIMNSPEYYPTRSEMEIFSDQTADLAAAMMIGGDTAPMTHAGTAPMTDVGAAPMTHAGTAPMTDAGAAPMTDDTAFDLIELGAGDASKSLHLLKYLLEQKAQFTYLPIDISGHIISYLELNLPVILPGISIKGLAGEYFDMLKKATVISNRRKVVLFLGSNIGNMYLSASQQFCKELREHLSPGDRVLMGFDLKKNPHTILAAYNDKGGITRRFNLNLLVRINRELGANFKIAQFDHYPCYNPETGTCKSYLISLVEQEVAIKGEVIHFDKDEYIDMETSQKFTLTQTDQLAQTAGFTPSKRFMDRKKWFLDALWVAENR